MEITLIKDSTFKLKGKTGFALADPKGITLESLDGASSKIFTSAGEYEVAGISVIGIKTDEGIVFVYEIDGLRICHLGNITKKLPDNKVSAIGDIDILIVPVTGESVEMIQQIEGYYIIPFGAKSDEELEKFLKESGLTVERLPKFSIKKDDLIEDSAAQIVVLSNK
ncbi:MAG: Zn-dependent hydrolase of the beta-lactamase fold-like protein [uncultured bacterium]|nr:MAG: Zn-dependent hydrolase of the beta-lactamase fold-like protein [uncultured bacterium]